MSKRSDKVMARAMLAAEELRAKGNRAGAADVAAIGRNYAQACGQIKRGAREVRELTIRLNAAIGLLDDLLAGNLGVVYFEGERVDRAREILALIKRGAKTDG